MNNFDVLIDLRPYIITFSLRKLPIVWFTSKLVSDPQRLFQISMDCSIDTSLIPSKIDKTYNDNVNLSGKVYEYFIGRDATAISELGAYFTDRHITKYVIDKVKPTLLDQVNIS